MKIVLLLLGAVAIAATALSLLRQDAWWIRICDFPRAQIGGLTLLTAAAYPWVGDLEQTGELVFFILLWPTLGYQTYRIFPYTRLAVRQTQTARRPKEDAAFSLMVANVLMGNHQADRLLKIIEQTEPDIVLTLETDRWWADRLQPLRRRYPFGAEHILNNTYGMMLFSRLRLLQPEVRFLLQNDIPSIYTQAELPSGDRFELYCLHPLPPVPPENERSTERDAELVLVGKQTKKSDRPVVVAGDMNDVGWSVTSQRFRRLSGLLDPRIGRGFFSTFHARYPGLRWPLDHIFHSEHWRLLTIERLPYFGSDHFPILIALSLEPDAPAQQPKPQPEAGDHEAAEAKIAAAEARD